MTVAPIDVSLPVVFPWRSFGIRSHSIAGVEGEEGEEEGVVVVEEDDEQEDEKEDKEEEEEAEEGAKMKTIYNVKRDE